MRPDTHLLVIGPDSFREAVGQALPRCQRRGASQPLAGVWEAGQQRFDGILLSCPAGKNVLRAVRSLRQVAPQARIVLACAPMDEPSAQQALEQGVDEYVIEPVTREDLEQALQIPTTTPPPISAPAPIPTPEPSLQEKVQFVDVIKNLNEGPEAALERMAELLRRTFEATCVTVEVHDFCARAGESRDPVLQEPIRSRDATVGAVTLGQRQGGTYSATTAARLADYARLIEAVVAVAQDRSHWQQLAWTDDLSRLHNRRYFERRFDELLAQCTRQRAHLTVLLLDIDDFKDYNDRLGHDTGDALIREVAELLQDCCREEDIVARYGGDEFAVIFWDAKQPRVPGSQHPREPIEFAVRFCQAMSKREFRCLGAGAPGAVTVSGGLASFPWDGNTREQLMRAADEALLAAKRTGKNRIQLASPPGAEPLASPADTPA